MKLLHIERNEADEAWIANERFNKTLLDTLPTNEQLEVMLRAALTTARVSPAAAKMLELIVNSPCVPPPRRFRILRDLLPPDRGEQRGVVVTVER